MTNRERIGLTEIVPDAVDPVYIYQDDSGIPTFSADGPYMLSDGVSLVDPMPVSVVAGKIAINKLGNACDAIPVTNLPNGDGPTPDPFVSQLLDFWTNENDLTQYTTSFNVAGPNVVLEMSFLFDGATPPFFTLTHGTDVLNIVAKQINEANGMGCLVAIASGIKAETAALKVSATGGTFGGVFGRIRKLDYTPQVAWVNGAFGTDRLEHPFNGSSVGEVVGVSIWKQSYTDNGKFSGIALQTRTCILKGEPIPYTVGPIQDPWVEVKAGVYELDTPNRPTTRTLFDFTFDTPVPAPIYWDFAATLNPGGITYTGVGDTTTNNNWSTGTLIGANITQEQSRYNSIYTGATFNGYGKCRVGNFSFYSNPTPYNSCIHRSAGVTGTVFRSSYATPWAAVAVCLQAPNTWSPFTITAGDNGDWIGFSSGDIASPPFNPPVGSISNEPNNTYEMPALYVDYADGSPVAIFHGDMLSSSEGLKVQIDGYEGAASDVSLFAGNTVIRFAPAMSAFEDGKTYGVVFTPAGDE